MKPSRLTMSLSVTAIALGTAACAPNQHTPLFFGQTQTLGVSMHGSAAEQGASLTVGFRDYDLAIVPIAVTQGDGTVTQLKSEVPDKDAHANHIDALSVLGQFNASADQTKMGVALGKFFATGMAAKTLADGFKTQLGAQPQKP